MASEIIDNRKVNLGPPKGTMERRKCYVCIESERISQIHHAIYGNGKPEEGILWKINEHSNFIILVKKIFWGTMALSVAGCLSAIGSFTYDVIKVVYGHH